jgi:hypothetical protein
MYFLIIKPFIMDFSVSKLSTVAECDQASSMATERKAALQFELTVNQRALNGQGKITDSINASMLSTVAEITGTEAAIAAIPDGQSKTDLQNKLRRLNDRKDNLTERLQKTGAAALLDTELENALLQAQIDQIELFVAAIAARKAAL